MKKLIMILSVIMCLAFSLALVGCGDPSIEGGVSGPLGNGCQHVWSVVNEPTHNDQGEIRCDKCFVSYQAPELWREYLYTVTDLPTEAKRYTFTHELVGVVSFELSNFVFEDVSMDEDGLKLIKYRGNSTDLEIPSTFDGNKVLVIGDDQTSPFLGANLNTLVIPNTVVKLGFCSLTACTSLTSLTVPGNLNFNGAFASMPETLKTITLNGKTIDLLDRGDFEHVETLYLTKDLERTRFSAFSTFDNLQKVYYDGSLADWCNIDFYNGYDATPMCKNPQLFIKENDAYTEVGDIVIPEGITTIKPYAFLNFKSQKAIIPDTVTTIGTDAFRDCVNLETIVIGNGVATINDSFSECESLSTVYYKGSSSDWNRIYIYSEGNYFLEQANRYYYSEQGDIFEYAKGNATWHYDQNNQPVLWEYQFDNNLDGKTYSYYSTDMNIDVYWEMLQEAERQGVLDYVFSTPEEKLMYTSSVDKEDYKAKLINMSVQAYTGRTISFANGKAVESDGVNSSYPADYIEYQGKVYNITTESVMFEIDLENGKLYAITQTEFFSTTITFLLNSVND